MDVFASLAFFYVQVFLLIIKAYIFARVLHSICENQVITIFINPKSLALVGVCVCVCFLDSAGEKWTLGNLFKSGIMSSKSLCTLVNYFCLFLDKRINTNNLLLCF